MTSSEKYLIENNNKGFHHRAKRKEQFPNEDSPAWSAAIAAGGSPEKLIADFRKSIRNGWRCSWIDFFGLHYKKFTQ